MRAIGSRWQGPKWILKNSATRYGRCCWPGSVSQPVRQLQCLLLRANTPSLGPADAERVREFASGRAYAKRALATLGMHNVDLPIGPNRAPIWPNGVVGSIAHVRDSHYGTYAAAAVARADAVLAVGLDFEMENSLHPHVWRHVLTKRELERILSLPAGSSSNRGAVYLVCKGGNG